MLRFVYLLSLLLCIELSFCYNYIDDGIEHNINSLRRNVRREKVRRLGRPYARKSRLRQEEYYDRSPVQFDVASFIQPEEDILETEEMVMKHKNNRRRNTQKPYDFGSILMKDDSSKMEKSTDYMNMADINPPLPKDLINPKHFNFNPLDDLNGGKYGHDKFRNIYKDDLLMNQNVHGHEKKCSLKTIKFPFFSHNKSEPLKPKKNKKRFFFFNNANKKELVEIPDFNKISEDPYKINYKIKRSYEQRLCPACKKLFLSSMNPKRFKKNPKQMIHNSRQFFQNMMTDATLKDDVKDHSVRRTRGSELKIRLRREERDRQMKELEEVQRKIDNVEIRHPHFEAPVPTTEKAVYNK